MREQRLLERIGAWQAHPERRAREDPQRTIDSVMAHLQRMLNTWQGNVPIGEDYGVPDFTNLVQISADNVREFERSLKHTIQKYEPRLTAIRVRFVPSEENVLSLRFQITGRLAGKGTRESVQFESVVSADGKFSVKR
jgi:type VI secretion system protein